MAIGEAPIRYPDADTLMAGPLGGWLEEQVATREQAWRDSLWRIGMVGLCAVPLALGLYLLPVSGEFKIWAFLGAMVAGGAWSQGPKRKAVKLVKTGINEAIAEAMGLRYEHDCEGGECYDKARDYRLLPGADRESFEDLWTGEPGGHRFTLREAHLEERRGSGKHRRWVTVFRGPIVTIGFARPFHATTLLARDGGHGNWFGRRKDEVKLGGERLSWMQMTHPEFEDVFDVYTTDPTEAQFLIDPLYVERLIAIEQLFAGSKIAALFKGGDLTVVLRGGNMFESGSMNAGMDRNRMATTIDQFARLGGLAEELNRIDREKRSA